MLGVRASAREPGLFFARQKSGHRLPLMLDRIDNFYDAIHDSCALTRGHFRELFWKIALLILVNLGAAFLHPALLLLTLPGTFLIWAAAYLDSMRQLLRPWQQLPIEEGRTLGKVMQGHMEEILGH
jgi:hypothetical protein